MYRVLLCDDHQIVLDGLRASLVDVSGIEVVGALTQAEQVLPWLATQMVDLVVLDINLGTTDGVALASQIRKTWPQVKVVALTYRKDVTTVQAFLATGAEGYLLKNDPTARIVDAFQKVLHGQRVLSTELVQVIFDAPRLRTGELLVLRLVCQGRTNKQISAELVVSMTTVERRRASLMLKAGVRSPAELSAWALHQGLV